MKAIWGNQILADSDKTIIIENNHYFPSSSLNIQHFKKSDSTTICPWKGTASYYNILVNGKENIDAVG
ncbi:MAG: DUF427 domain-containing protein [Gammaproteobacteria bacterium]|nr:DUF427 domain-containing protein [Gammaproteobacteria bacterium]